MSRVLVFLLAACGTPEPAEVAPPVAPAPAAPTPPVTKAPPGPAASIGQPVDLAALPVDRWYRPYKADGTVAVVVFWELWCPHCKREVPKLQAIDAIEGVQVIGLTRQTKGVKDEDLEAFLAGNNVSYAVGHADDSLSKRLQIRSVPTAVVVKEGKVVWQGNPAALTPAKLEEWI